MHSCMDVRALTERIQQFVAARDWEQFHEPRNLLLALVCEVGEIADLFRYRTDAEIRAGIGEVATRAQVQRELADVAICLLRLADVLEVDVEAAVVEKLAENESKYPAERVRGSAMKYTEYERDKS